MKKKREFSRSDLSRPVASTRYSLSWALLGNARDALLRHPETLDPSDAIHDSINSAF